MPCGRPSRRHIRPNHARTCAVSEDTARAHSRRCSRAGTAQAECVVEQMRNLASDTGRVAVAGDVVTLQAPWAAPSATTATRRSSVARLRTADREAAEELFNACYPR